MKDESALGEPAIDEPATAESAAAESGSATLTSALPDLARPDVNLVEVHEWTVGTMERQRLLIDGAIAAWRSLPWPETLVSVNWLASFDGERVLAYIQWTSDEQAAETRRTDGPTLPGDLFVDRDGPDASTDREAVPGVTRAGPVLYRLYRSAVRSRAGSPVVPGCIVVVSVELDGPDEQRQRAWIDTVFEALDAETAPHPGGISGYFHASTDGTRVLNYAEWLDEASHRDALERSGQGTVGSNPKWRLVQTFPGLKSSGFQRYRFECGLVGPRSVTARTGSVESHTA